MYILKKNKDFVVKIHLKVTPNFYQLKKINNYLKLFTNSTIFNQTKHVVSCPL
jgi:hypothetical protein